MTEFVRNLAVVIGINQYQNGIQPLKTAVPDAHKLADILQTHHHYQLIHPTAELGGPILDGDATLPQLRDLFENVLPKQVQPNQGDRLPGLFHSKERFEQIKSLPSFSLSLSHVVKAMVSV